MSLLTGSPRSASVTAVTDTALVEIKRHHLQPVLEANSGIIDDLGEIQASRLSALELAKNVSHDDRAEISKIGMKGYLKRQITRFFNIGP
jgi:CRP-like cAMP-binding protein